MVGIFNQRPPLPRYGFTWDIELVLKYMNGLDSSTISIELLTYKLTALLALTAASRASELSMLDTRFLSKYHSVYVFKVKGVVKTQKPGKSLPKLEFFRFEENLSLCVCHTIDKYLERTKENRGNTNQLLLSVDTAWYGFTIDNKS